VIKSDGPRSDKGVAKVPSTYEQRGGNTTISTDSSAVPAASTSLELRRLRGETQSQSGVSKLLSPPDIFLTVKTDSIMDQAVVKEGYEEKEEDDHVSEDRHEAVIAAREIREYVTSGKSNTLQVAASANYRGVRWMLGFA
jgi:hypothetical protein